MKTIIFILFIISIKVSFSQWVEISSPVTTPLRCVTIPNPNTRWACGDSGIVIKSTYGFGFSFHVLNNGIPSNVMLINIFAMDSAVAFTAGYSGPNTYLYRTSNGGYNWQLVLLQQNGNFNAVWMRNALTGILVGNPVGGRWSIWKTSSGGINWDSSGLMLPQSGNETGWNNSMYFVDSGFSSATRKLWFGTNNSRIYYSTNFGTNWSVQSTAPDTNSCSILFNSDYQTSNGNSGGNSFEITTNNGLNWSTNTSIGAGKITGLAGNNPGVNDFTFYYEWYVRGDNKIYYSASGGFNWVIQFTASSGNFTYMSQCRPGGAGQIFAVRDNGGISYCSCTPSGLENQNEGIPDKFSLSQNYPNPFNPSTTIKFDVPDVGNVPRTVRLMIYDVIGKEVKTLINEQLQPGSYSADWDASNFPSGVYFYKLEAGDYSESKKMLMIK